MSQEPERDDATARSIQGALAKVREGDERAAPPFEPMWRAAEARARVNTAGARRVALTRWGGLAAAAALALFAADGVLSRAPETASAPPVSAPTGAATAKEIAQPTGAVGAPAVVAARPAIAPPPALALEFLLSDPQASALSAFVGFDRDPVSLNPPRR